MKSLFIPGTAIMTAAAAVYASIPLQRTVSYSSEVKPFLEKHCAPCHFGGQRQGGLSLGSVTQILKGGNKGSAVTPGKATESRLVLLMEHKAEPRMPPIPNAKPLNTRLIRVWIDQGAKDDSKPTDRPAPNPTPYPPAQHATDKRVASAAFSPDGRTLAIGRYSGVTLLESNSGRSLGALKTGAVTAVAFSPGGTRLMAAGGQPGRSGELQIWNLSTRKQTAFRSAHGDAIYSLAVSPNGKWIAAGSYDQRVSVWDSAGKPRYLQDHTDSVYGVAFSPDSRLIASAGGDRTVKVWSAQTGKRLYTLNESTAEVYSVAFSPNGKQIAAGGADRTLRTWDITPAGGKLRKAAFAHDGPILRVIFAGDGKTILTSGQDRMVKRWDAATLAEKTVYPKQPDWPQAIALSPNEKLLAVGRLDGSLALYDAESGRLLREPLKPPAAAANPDAIPTSSLIPGRRPGDNRRVPRKNGPITLTPAALNGITPAGTQRGRTVRFTLSGANISDATGVFFDDPGIIPKIVLPADSNRGILRIDAAIPESARVGIHRVFVNSPRGTTGSVAFAVGAWAEVAQTEPNEDARRAQVIKLPATVTGAMDQPGDVDTYGVEANAGQEIVFEVIAQPIRSRLQPVIRILDPAGNPVAENRTIAGRTETVVGYKCRTSGTHFVQVSDYEGASGGDVYYRLNAGEFPVVTSAFPLGIRQGSSSTVRIAGFNLGNRSEVQVAAPGETAWGRTIKLAVDSLDLLHSVELAVGADPEVMSSNTNGTLGAAQPIPVPVTVNGRLARPDHPSGSSERVSNYFRFRAKKGEKLILETQARRLGSQLDSEIEVLDTKGNPVERAVLRAVGQTELVLVDRDSASVGLRLQAWDDFRVNDYVLAGRELIQIQRLPAGPDEDVFFRAYRGQRIAFMGTTPEYHSLGEPIYKVEVHPPGAAFSPNGYPLRKLYYRNDDGGPLYGKDSYLEFTPPADGEYVVKLTDPRGQSGQEYPYRLSIRRPRPDFRLAIGSQHPNVPGDGAAVIEVTCERYDGFDGPIGVGFDSLPPGFTATRTMIEQGETSAFLQVNADMGAVKTMHSRLVGVASIDGKPVTRSVEPPDGRRIFTALPPPDIKMTTSAREVSIRPGEEVTLEAAVERLGEFGNRVPVIVQNLPFGVRVTDIGLNGVLITEEEQSRRFTLFAEPWVKPQVRTFYVSGNVEGGIPNAALPLTLRVLPARRAAR